MLLADNLMHAVCAVQRRTQRARCAARVARVRGQCTWPGARAQCAQCPERAPSASRQDLHPGNILLDAAGPRLVLLDVGMVARLTPAESGAFIGLLHAFGAGDGRRAARVVLRFAEEQTCETTEARRAFEDDMHAVSAMPRAALALSLCSRRATVPIGRPRRPHGT
eukprot:3272677-Prymnesium_polylepis.2